MRVFRRSFIKCRFTKTVLFPMVIGAIICIIILVGYTQNLIDSGMTPSIGLAASIALMPFVIALLSLLATQYFYIIVNDEDIVVINGVFPFISKTYKLRELDKCVLGNAGGLSLNYFEFIRNGKGSWKYVIDMVDSKDYDTLITILSHKGIQVEKKEGCLKSS